MPSTTNLEEEEIVDDLRNDGNASMPEQVNLPKPWGDGDEDRDINSQNYMRYLKVTTINMLVKANRPLQSSRSTM